MRFQMAGAEQLLWFFLKDLPGDFVHTLSQSIAFLVIFYLCQHSGVVRLCWTHIQTFAPQPCPGNQLRPPEDSCLQCATRAYTWASPERALEPSEVKSSPERSLEPSEVKSSRVMHTSGAKCATRL